MRIKCIALRPTKTQILRMRGYFDRTKSDYDLDLGREYLALGVGFWDGMGWVEIATDGEWVLTVPLCLFDIVDGRPSQYWAVKYNNAEECITLWPSLFYAPTFHSRPADGVPEAVTEFRRIRSLLEEEYPRDGTPHRLAGS